MMSFSRLTAAVLCGTLLVLVSSCSDPASVGSSLGPDSLAGGDPQKEEIVPSSFDTSTTPSLTGYAPSPNLPPDQRRTWRFLTGVVDDPIAGVIRADGYVDFDGSASRSSDFNDASADSLDAQLRLSRAYLHGDTTTTLQVELFDLSQDADMTRAPADTAFEAEPQPIRSYSVAPTDTLVTLSLPQAWIEEHQSALQNSDSFEDTVFDGFKLATTNRSAVIGFEYGSATLRVTTSSDTVDFQAAKSFTHIEREQQPPPTPADQLLLQDGVGVGLSMAWTDGTIDSLAAANVLLNRAEITVPVDTTLLEPPAGSPFVRPLPSGYRVLATRAEGAPLCNQLGLFSLSQAGTQCIFPTLPAWVPAAARVVPQNAFTIFDRWFFGEPPLSTFRVEVTARTVSTPNEQQTARRGVPSTVPVLIRTAAADTEVLPRAILTVTPL